MSDYPKLVELDPWLESNSEAIQERIQMHQDAAAEIISQFGSLKAFANLHQEYGIHFSKEKQSWTIKEWAPAAQAISLVGQFNDWNGESHQLSKGSNGIWLLELPQDALKHGDLFKLRITGADGQTADRIPACIRRVVQAEQTHDFLAQVWQPEKEYQWLNSHDASKVKTPLIYEAHVGIAGEEARVHNYKEFTEHVLPRIAKLGYNVLQLMAVQEHPYYGSFGYHVSSFFAVSSRYGTPEDLKQLIDTAHGLGISVLLDVVHSHAIKNTAEGLNNFDGSGHQYFKEGDAGEHPQWDSKCFDYNKTEVVQFLLSNVRFWLEEYRFDGFRFDGVTSMLYHHHGDISFDNYDKYFKDGVDFAAVTYLQLANQLANQLNPDALIIAEDMSGMPGLCRPISEGGIGFTHRLAMGVPDYWIKLLKHQKDEEWNLEELWGTLTNRRHGEANIAYAESHDQALVGDKTIAFWLMDAEMYWSMSKDKRNHVIDRGIALHKMIRLITATAAGEGYLNFIGNEFGHPEWLDFPREGNDWSCQYSRRQWSLVDNHDLCYHWLNDFDQAMIQLLAQYNEIKEFGNTYQRWLHNEDKVLAFSRGELLFIFNFNVEKSFEGYLIPVYDEGDYRLLLDSDAEMFGGFGRVSESAVYPTQKDNHNGTFIQCYLPTRTALVLTRDS